MLLTAVFAIARGATCKYFLAIHYQQQFLRDVKNLAFVNNFGYSFQSAVV